MASRIPRAFWVEMTTRLIEHFQGILESACMVVLEGKDHSTIKAMEIIRF